MMNIGYCASSDFRKEIVKKVIRVPIPIWNQEMWIARDPTVCDCIDNKLLLLEDNSALGATVEISTPREGRFVLVWGANMDVGTLVHELVHVGLIVLENAGVATDGTKGEPLAYLIGFLFERVVAAGFFREA